jgi:hypothetical protein
MMMKEFIGRLNNFVDIKDEVKLIENIKWELRMQEGDLEWKLKTKKSRAEQ